MDLDMNIKEIHEVRAQDLTWFIDHHYPDAAVHGDVADELFCNPTSETVHLVRALEKLGDYDTQAVTRWLNGERGSGANGLPDDVLSFMAAEGKIPFGEYLVVFN
jgi:hypothetical protein